MDAFEKKYPKNEKGGGEGRKLAKIRVSDLSDSPFQPRLNTESANIDEIAKNIKINGLIDPIKTRLVGNKYEIIDGHRRKYALLKLETDEVEVIIKKDCDDETARIEVLTSFLSRKGLSVIETALSIYANSLYVSDINLLSSKLGCSVKNTRRYVKVGKLLKEPEALKISQKNKLNLDALLTLESIWNSISEIKKTDKLTFLKYLRKLKQNKLNSKKLKSIANKLSKNKYQDKDKSGGSEAGNKTEKPDNNNSLRKERTVTLRISLNPDETLKESQAKGICKKIINFSKKLNLTTNLKEALENE